MGLALLKSGASQADVEVAWATYRSLLLAEVNDPALLEDCSHQLAITVARQKFERLYDDWSQS